MCIYIYIYKRIIYSSVIRLSFEGQLLQVHASFPFAIRAATDAIRLDRSSASKHLHYKVIALYAIYQYYVYIPTPRPWGQQQTKNTEISMRRNYSYKIINMKWNISIHQILKRRDLTLGRLTCSLLGTLIGAEVATLVGPVLWEMDAKASVWYNTYVYLVSKTI